MANDWFAQAREVTGREPNAMTVATASASAVPSARMVLLKEVDDRGFVFYTNYRSAKGQDLEVNPRAALLFFWAELERQVRVVGRSKDDLQKAMSLIRETDYGIPLQFTNYRG